MFKSLIFAANRWLVGLQKNWGDLVDVFKPRGDVEARLIYANGPRRGTVARTIKGRNIVTSWLAPDVFISGTSGRDMLRRIMAPASFSGSLYGAAAIGKMELGSGTVAETSADTTLDSPISPTTKKNITNVVFDPLNPYVTFICEWDETEANATISEASLLSDRTPEDFVARKTFGAFTKTSDFILEIRWTIRF